jgi:glycosyltransferase involved in cell wall biosynthesis
MDLSVVIPVHNEALSINILFERLVKAVGGLNNIAYEIIFINDGSTDR